MSIISLRGVSKQYGSTTALRNVDLTVEEGEVYGFLGPNGAGKSTTIDLLLDYLRPTSGTVEVFGHESRSDPVAIRRRTGILPEDFTALSQTTGREHIEFAIDARNADDDPDAILARVGLSEDGDKLATGYSTGMTQRLALGMALVGEPDLLILDEPSSGLDPHGVRRMREIVRAEQERGASVFFSSHILSQVEAVADTVGIISDGKLIAEDPIETLRQSFGNDGAVTITLTGSVQAAARAVEEIDAVTGVEIDGQELTVDCPNETKIEVLETAHEHSPIENVIATESSLEELFVAQTERSE